jgi:predicted aconitate hydratase
MPQNVAQKLISSHLELGDMEPGAEIGLRIDQTLTQDATGTMVMLEFERIALSEVRTELSAQYVDHNLLQADFRNADDHEFLRSACEKWGIWYSKPGNGVSHPVHQQRFGVPGKTLLGSDSHTPAAGSIGMLAIGAGGLEVAMAMAGEPFHLKMPRIWGVRLVGELPDWVSAKDVVLEMLRRHDVSGGVGRIIEYHGPGLESLTAWDRHVIANMGTELGATTTVFPADEEVRRFLASEEREDDYAELVADEGARYDDEEEIVLSDLEPLIARPSSPGDVVPVGEVAGTKIGQVLIGSSANPGYRDFAVAASIVNGRHTHHAVSFDVNPTSRQTLAALAREGHVGSLIQAGARMHQAGCLGCIGMGQAPGTDVVSLRTMPRNFPGRSGTPDDKVYLCSPETAAASALRGEIADPRELDMEYPREVDAPSEQHIDTRMLVPPDPKPDAELLKGPNVASIPDQEPLEAAIEAEVLLKLSDNVSTDEIMKAGAQALPYRSNVPELAKYCFEPVDDSFYERAVDARDEGGGGIVVARDNYGQGSSREHAAIVPAFLGVRALLAHTFGRIHWQNLVNFGIVPLNFLERSDLDRVDQGDTLALPRLREELEGDGDRVTVENRTRDETFEVRHELSDRQKQVLLAGGLINAFREGKTEAQSA